MHALAEAFLALYLAHLLTDFVFQSDRIVAQKKKGELGGYARHGGVHLFAALFFVGFAAPSLMGTLNCYAVVFGLTAIHLLIDRGKLALTRSQRISDSARSFVFDQILHVVTVLIAAWLLVRTPLSELVGKVSWVQFHREEILVLLVVYIGVIFGGGYLVRFLTKPLLKGDLHLGNETTGQLQNAGMYIGWLERFLVLTALMLQSPATVGLILTAKSIARYPEFKSVRFAEYFLIGTLLSISMGIIGGLLLLKAFSGTVVSSK